MATYCKGSEGSCVSKRPGACNCYAILGQEGERQEQFGCFFSQWSNRSGFLSLLRKTRLQLQCQGSAQAAVARRSPRTRLPLALGTPRERGPGWPDETVEVWEEWLVFCTERWTCRFGRFAVLCGIGRGTRPVFRAATKRNSPSASFPSGLVPAVAQLVATTGATRFGGEQWWCFCKWSKPSRNLSTAITLRTTAAGLRLRNSPMKWRHKPSSPLAAGGPW